MSSVYYAALIIVILLVVRWAMLDEMGNGQGRTGLFAMTARRRKDSAKRARSRFRRSGSE